VTTAPSTPPTTGTMPVGVAVDNTSTEGVELTPVDVAVDNISTEGVSRVGDRTKAATRSWCGAGSRSGEEKKGNIMMQAGWRE
jgi:hypothetical protein